MKQKHVVIDPVIHHNLKVIAAREGKSVKDLADQLIRGQIQKWEAENGPLK